MSTGQAQSSRRACCGDIPRAGRAYVSRYGRVEPAATDWYHDGAGLATDGCIRDVEGYDAETGLWCCRVPKLVVPERPSFADSDAALRCLRGRFKTFPFADAVRRHEPHLDADVVDLAESPGRDESAFLVALLTAVCRPSLWRAPGFLIEAPALSGAGTGKGPKNRPGGGRRCHCISARWQQRIARSKWYFLRSGNRATQMALV